MDLVTKSVAVIHTGQARSGGYVTWLLLTAMLAMYLRLHHAVRS